MRLRLDDVRTDGAIGDFGVRIEFPKQKTRAQHAHEIEQVLVLTAQTIGQAGPDGVLESGEAIGQRHDGVGPLVLKLAQGGGLLVIDSTLLELRQGLFVDEALRKPLDELY